MRAVLQEIAGDAAAAALASIVLSGDGSRFRLGAIAALGRRTGAVATEALRKSADDPDPRIRAAAAAAMANGAEPGFDGAIQAALDPAKGVAAHADANRLRLRLASNLAKAGRKNEAKRIFDAVAAGPHEACCKKAVAAGLKALGGQ